MSCSYFYKNPEIGSKVFNSSTDSRFADKILGRAIEADPKSAPATTMALQWLSEFDESHLKCHQKSVGLLPTRVIDFGLQDSEIVYLRSPCPGTLSNSLHLVIAGAASKPLRLQRTLLG